MLLRGQVRWEVILIIELGNTEVTKYPDTSGFSIMVGGGGVEFCCKEGAKEEGDLCWEKWVQDNFF